MNRNFCVIMYFYTRIFDEKFNLHLFSFKMGILDEKRCKKRLIRQDLIGLKDTIPPKI